MRKSLILAAGAIAAAGLITPAVAHADTSDDTVVSFIVLGAGGNLSITTGPVGTIVPEVSGEAASGSLPLVSVTDSRNGSPRAWTTSAVSTDFVSGTDTISKNNVTYNATGLAGKVGPGTVASTGETNIGTTAAVVNRTGLTFPTEVITWTPLLKVSYPGGTAIGTYSGTITVSVA